MENKFKVGDKVVVTSLDAGDGKCYNTGDIGVVHQMDCYVEELYWVDFSGQGNDKVEDNALQLVRESQIEHYVAPTKEENSPREFSPDSYFVYRANKDYMTEDQCNALKNLLQRVEEDEQFEHNIHFDDEERLSDAFYWSETSQGYDYWGDAYDQVEKAKKHLNSASTQETTEQNSAVAFLKKAAELQENRAKEYDQEGGERSAGKIAAAFNAITGHNLTESDVWMLLVVLKQVRFYNNPANRHRDSVEDLVSYAALFAESVFKQ